MLSSSASQFGGSISSIVGAVQDISLKSELMIKYVDFMESYDVYVAAQSLTYLEKGGRINKTSAIVGTLLDIKPVLTIKNGLIEAVEKIRGRKKLYKKLVELVREHPDFDDENPEFIVVQSNEEYGEELKELLIEEFGVEDLKYYVELGPVIGTHIGPGTLAVLFKLKQS